MRERPIMPCWLISFIDPGSKQLKWAPVIVPHGVYPYDLYNALLYRHKWVTEELGFYGVHWLTSEGNVWTEKETIDWLIANNQLDSVPKRLCIPDFKGKWHENK